MSIEIQKRGNREFLTLTFGTGDIAIIRGAEQETPDFITITEVDAGSSSNDLPEGSVFFEFTKVESIDNLIEALEEVKEGLLKLKASKDV